MRSLWRHIFFWIFDLFLVPLQSLHPQPITLTFISHECVSPRGDHLMVVMMILMVSGNFFGGGRRVQCFGGVLAMMAVMMITMAKVIFSLGLKIT